ncbi:MAG: TOBE domain-containing protein [Desulfobacterales bacterium]|jgi:molybdate transport system regulatory protein|nr:TOBE domain-containing protein [Desulfobacterales bacterium]
MNSNTKIDPTRTVSPTPLSESRDHGRIVSIPEDGNCLDTVQLNRLEQSFREWAESSPRADVRLSRRRILFIFLLIRYTGAKLSEVLALNPFEDIDPVRRAIFFRGNVAGMDSSSREVQVSETLSREIQDALADPLSRGAEQNMFHVDPGFVRRKFYERTQDCGFPKRLGGPEMIRKARAVELMQGNMPLPAVQMMLGHSTPNLTSSYVSFSKEEIQQVAKRFMEKESVRKTSARNSFFGKIQNILRDDIQARVELTTLEGHSITTVITNESVERLGLTKGRLITAEVKAPWVFLQKGGKAPVCSSDNKMKGVLERITTGRINTECVVRISDATKLCAVISTTESRNLNLTEGEDIWALFSCFSVVLHAE